MHQRVLFGLKVLVLQLLRDNGCLGSNEVFTLEKFSKGGLIEEPKGFLCLSVHRTEETGLRGNHDLREEPDLKEKIPEEREILFSCEYASKKKAPQIGSFKIQNPDREFMEQVSMGKSLFMKEVNLLEEMVDNITMFEWGEMKYSEFKRSRNNTVIKENNTTVLGENKTSMAIDRNNIFTTKSPTRSEFYTLKSALVFYITVNGRSPKISSIELAQKVFGTSGSMSSQYVLCSNSKMIINPATGPNIVNGVVSVKVFPDWIDVFRIRNLALVAVHEMGINTWKIDHCLFVFPPGVTWGGDYYWYAFADTDGDKSYYNNDAGWHVKTLMHEVGHNLGLSHANENGEYEDQTSAMGSGFHATYICFNGGQMNFLGWHKEREVKVDPRIKSFSGNIIGINDISFSATGDVLVLEIVHGSNDKRKNLFLNYNNAKGINSDTAEYQNEIIVTQKRSHPIEDPLQMYPSTELLYHIPQGSFVTIDKFYDSLNLMIFFEKAGTRGNVNFGLVSVWVF